MREIIGNTTATPNPQPDWSQTNENKADFIKNKPEILTEEQVIDLIDTYGGDTQIQANWNQTDNTKADFIKNKPTIPSVEGLASEEYVDQKVESSHMVNITQMHTIYNNYDELKGVIPSEGNGARYVVRTNGKTPLYYYSYNASTKEWEKGYQLKGSTLFLNLNDGCLYRYTNSATTKPYPNFIRMTLNPDDIVTEETDPTVPAWAKEENKPTYKYIEIQETPTIPTKTSDLVNDSNFVTTSQIPNVADGYVNYKQQPLEFGALIESGDTIIFNLDTSKLPSDILQATEEVLLGQFQSADVLDESISYVAMFIIGYDGANKQLMYGYVEFTSEAGQPRYDITAETINNISDFKNMYTIPYIGKSVYVFENDAESILSNEWSYWSKGEFVQIINNTENPISIPTGVSQGYVDYLLSLLADKVGTKVDKISGKGLSTNDLTDELKGNYDTAYSHSQADHAPTDAQANIIENITVNGTTQAITSKTVNITVPTGSLANKSKVSNDDLSEELKTKIEGKANKSTTLAGYGITDAATLDATGRVPSTQLPSYVDDVLEYAAKSSFPATGETGKIYIDVATNITYRWSGSIYTPIGSDLALGETSSTAYYGDKGKSAYVHSQITSGNPHGVTKSDIDLGNVDNKSVAEIKIEFTGEVKSGNTGFVTGDTVNNEITNIKNGVTTVGKASKILIDGTEYTLTTNPDNKGLDGYIFFEFEE